ncbi:MAG: hypothetical protein A3C35_03940 [Omnitrophica bacterium RIFCSPHIGHO2_02_FULL_46_11]|nr:MAG: hypothetical protein A3A81_07005 [Omnitrophica bacterium RIFCSPLOWO2_01_FULL_45_10b]OGW86032.1 MAG: hypothetical protein A3C35_03940 [Omnitrophica bacterium RIFCSPHIGHO2_02_FULL_46_11]
MKANIAGLLAYLLGFVSGLVFLLIEKNNKFVRFHAMQSIIVFCALFLLRYILLPVPFLGLVANGVLSVVGIALWVVLMVKAYQGEKFKLPWIGDIAEKSS